MDHGGRPVPANESGSIPAARSDLRTPRVTLPSSTCFPEDVASQERPKRWIWTGHGSRYCGDPHAHPEVIVKTLGYIATRLADPNATTLTTHGSALAWPEQAVTHQPNSRGWYTCLYRSTGNCIRSTHTDRKLKFCKLKMAADRHIENFSSIFRRQYFWPVSG